MKLLNRTAFFLVNIIIALLIVGLQFLYYGFAPAINPNIIYKDDLDKKAACIEATMSFNKTLILEMIIGTIIIVVFNYYYFRETSRRPIKNTVIMGLIFILIAGITLAFLSIDYVDRNMGR